MVKRQAVVGIDDIVANMDALKTLREPISRAMGAAMGQAVRDEAKVRAPVLKPGNEGVDNQRAGQLRDALYVAFDGRRSILSTGHYVYGVSWNSRKAPHGHLAEFGHWMPYEAVRTESGKWVTPLVGKGRVGGKTRGVGVPLPNGGFFVSAQPFLGPAFDAKMPRLAGIAAEAGALKFQQLSPSTKES
jgi:hypothetical protein